MAEEKDEQQISEDAQEKVTSEEQSAPIEETQDTLEAEGTEEDKLKEAQDKYLRLYSEFENFRRRSAKEKIELIKNASAGLAKDMLGILDDFDRAVKANEAIEDPTALKEGFKLIHDKYKKTLGAKGITEIDAVGEVFDVDKHEALTQIPVEGDQKGKVIEVVEKGYMMNESVLRYPKVVVGQ